jgi:solute carrier family 39 (zinc transporter), member 1/2/3
MSDLSNDSSPDLACGSVRNENTYFGLRIAAIFIIMVTSALGALFPIITRRSKLKVPEPAYEYVFLRAEAMKRVF